MRQLSKLFASTTNSAAAIVIAALPAPHSKELDELNAIHAELLVNLSKLQSALLLIEEATIVSETIAATKAELERNITRFIEVHTLLGELIENLQKFSLDPFKIKNFQEQLTRLIPDAKKITDPVELILSRLGKRIWQTPGLPDFDLEIAKKTLTDSLPALAGHVEATQLQKDIISELEAWPNLTSVNKLIERLNCLSASMDSALAEQSHEILFALKNHLSQYFHAYSPEEIASSYAIQRCMAPKVSEGETGRESMEEIHDSRGSYVVYPSEEDKMKGLGGYVRNNRPHLRLYDETGDAPKLCFKRNPGKEEPVIDLSDFEAAIRAFCDGNEAMIAFMCANLGIEPFLMTTSENLNTLRLPEAYIPLFRGDNYLISWHKLKGDGGEIYYQHRLVFECYQLMSLTGKVYYLPEIAALRGFSKLVEVETEADYESLLKAGARVAPVLSTTSLAEIRCVASTEATAGAGTASTHTLKLSIVEYGTSIHCDDIETKRPLSLKSLSGGSSSDSDTPAPTVGTG